MRDIPGWPVTINHDHRLGACISNIIETLEGIDGLSCSNFGSFISEAHFPCNFEDEVNFLLFLVVPRHLSAARFERYVLQAKSNCNACIGLTAGNIFPVTGAPGTCALDFPQDRQQSLFNSP